MSTSREELIALAAKFERSSLVADELTAHEKLIAADALRLAATPKAVVDHTPTSNLVVHPDIAEALSQACEYFENRADVNDGDYGVPEPNTEMRLAQMCNDALDRISILPSVLGGVDQQETQTTKPSPSSTPATATETACHDEFYEWLNEAISDGELEAAESHDDDCNSYGAGYDSGYATALREVKFQLSVQPFSSEVAETDASDSSGSTPPAVLSAPDNAGLVSGGGK